MDSFTQTLTGANPRLNRSSNLVIAVLLSFRVSASFVVFLPVLNMHSSLAFYNKEYSIWKDLALFVYALVKMQALDVKFMLNKEVWSSEVHNDYYLSETEQATFFA